MQKTRLKSDACHGIGDHLIDPVAEVGVGIVGLLAVVVVLSGLVLNGKRARGRPKSRANGEITGLKAE